MWVRSVNQDLILHSGQGLVHGVGQNMDQSVSQSVGQILEQGVDKCVRVKQELYVCRGCIISTGLHIRSSDYWFRVLRRDCFLSLELTQWWDQHWGMGG